MFVSMCVYVCMSGVCASMCVYLSVCLFICVYVCVSVCVWLFSSCGLMLFILYARSQLLSEEGFTLGAKFDVDTSSLQLFNGPFKARD